MIYVYSCSIIRTLEKRYITYQREEEEGVEGDWESQRSHGFYFLCGENWVSSSSSFDLKKRCANSFKEIRRRYSTDLRSQWTMNTTISLHIYNNKSTCADADLLLLLF